MGARVAGPDAVRKGKVPWGLAHGTGMCGHGQVSQRSGKEFHDGIVLDHFAGLIEVIVNGAAG
ncbi:MAG TPA: hypothetical protein DC058_16660, partial [Planctomycetaceae bacterium]|nr:hypothetical protein [Planctomycetaceae bacterium]